MKSITKRNNRGFTIIEVVLVLAIAGLIFLMVLIVVPAMNRNSRDTARKNDVSLVSQAVTNYTGANRNAWPTAGRLEEYVDKLSGNSDASRIFVIDPKPSGDYTISDLNDPTKENGFYVVTEAKCGESGKSEQKVLSASKRQFIVVNLLEAGGGQYYCIEG